MLVAAILLALGFFLVAYVTQTRGLRMGGTVVVPVLTLYTLKNFVALPVFLVSFGMAYVALWIGKQYTLIFGRDELVVAIVSGSLLPLGLLFFGEYLGIPQIFDLRAALFLGSILPGLAAYNVQQIKPEYRRQDLLFTVGIYVGLLIVGATLIDPRLAQPLGTHTPLVLFSETSNIAVVRGAVLEGTLDPLLMPRSLAVGLLVVAFLVSEWGRDRFGIRAGVVSMGLLAIYATASKWLVLLFLLDFVVALFIVGVVHQVGLLYGRVLIGIGTGFALLVSIPFALLLPIVRGLSAIFVAVLAGTTAYNNHVTAPKERRMRTPLALIIFAPLFVLSRVVGQPYDRALLAGVPTVPWVLVLSVVTVIGSYLLLRYYRIEQPSDEEILSASVLSGGEG